MSIENITFENIDTPKEKAIKTALIYAGSTELKNQMKKSQNKSQIYLKVVQKTQRQQLKWITKP